MIWIDLESIPKFFKMRTFTSAGYDKLLSMGIEEPIDKIMCLDHLGGFSATLDNDILDKVADLARGLGHPIELHNSYLFTDQMQKKYPAIKFKFDAFYGFYAFKDYNVHPSRTFSHFLSSFNGSEHVSRKMLVAVLDRFGWFDTDTCSKNFRFTVDSLDGHLSDYLDSNAHRFYRPFFIGDNKHYFFDSIHSFGHERNNHARNVYNLEHRLTKSFLNIVSETLATSYYPFFTEKFLYSIVTRGLFLAYAQPGWHDHLEKYFGFRRFDKIFDYRFDTIKNPIGRLVELMSMIAKFSVLSTSDWRDLYEMEIDTIEYNYDHYFSGRYLKELLNDA